MADAPKNKGPYAWASLIGLIITGVVVIIFVWGNPEKKDDGKPLVQMRPKNVMQKYANALEVAMKFFDVQKAGKLVNTNISWRGDSALKDGSQAGLDLSKGMYDAGDHIKSSYPMAFTATMLSWAILEYGDHMDMVKQLEPARDSLKWITDYLINAHPSPNKLYFQVGDPEVDHRCWEKPETMDDNRPLLYINESKPGSDVAGEASAALASASIVYKKIDPKYSGELLTHAQQLHTFATTYNDSYITSFPKMQNYYNSSGFKDEILWSSIWLFHATHNKSYLTFVQALSDDNDYMGLGGMTVFSLDDKSCAAQLLVARLSFFDTGTVKASDKIGQDFRIYTDVSVCGMLPGAPLQLYEMTKGGLIWEDNKNALEYPVAQAFLTLLYSDYMLSSNMKKLNCDGKYFTPADLRKFAISQVNFVLGQNEKRMSYLVGYGTKYPQFVHHRGASIPADETPSCKKGFEWLNSTKPNPNIATGAMVGGPNLDGEFSDMRKNLEQLEPFTYNSALLVGLLSGLVSTSTVNNTFI
ncbi:hypothetical protein GIB67_007193 [Kingdonia uniflora]|uniref:cellulase n=1 Tax=Kingdonia uniflora TaxID=39325 RepID=A0A7J7NEB3_9MAGN|nr:hypothetical protein GIB67_007193 [Kingdonia uniflora]